MTVNPANLNRPAQPKNASLEEHASLDWLPDPQFWIDSGTVNWPSGLQWAVAFKHVTASTNVRTMVSCIVPYAGFGNSIPVLLPGNSTVFDVSTFRKMGFLIVANLNSYAFDFVTRQKVQGQNLNLFVVEQLPVITIDSYDLEFGNTSARELVRDHVLRLTYTANDMMPFARDLGYEGLPFDWDEEERRHLQARLDALYFLLYGLNRDDAGYVLDTFPIVRRDDEQISGCYRTRDMILAYMNALAAGDAETVVAV